MYSTTLFSIIYIAHYPVTKLCIIIWSMLRNWNTNTHTTPPYDIDLNTDTAPHPHYILYSIACTSLYPKTLSFLLWHKVIWNSVVTSKALNVDEIETSTTSRHQPSYCHLKRNTQHSISRSYYLYYSPLQHNSDPNTDTAPYPISYNRHTQTLH